jgi:serine/threonine protein kinase
MDVDDLCTGCFGSRGGAPVCPACGWVEGRAPANPVHLRPRTLLRDHYVVGRVLGHGGFGIAYIAWDTTLEMKVALKEFLPGDHATRGADGTTVTPYSGDSREHFEYGLTKFLDEGRAVARFNDHPGIVPVLGFFREHGTGYLVMQYVPGMSLLEYLRLKGGRIPFAHAVEIAIPVMDTLRAVHEVGLLHRDISPDNIYITSTGRVKLLDFGAARHALGDRSQSLSMILKSGYAPFEQYQTRGRQGPYTDVYALAATIYRCITGEPPTEAPSRVVDDPLAPPRTHGVDMPPAAEAVLLRAMAVDASRRYQDVREFQDALMEVMSGALPKPSPDAPIASVTLAGPGTPASAVSPVSPALPVSPAAPPAPRPFEMPPVLRQFWTWLDTIGSDVRVTQHGLIAGAIAGGLLAITALMGTSPFFPPDSYATMVWTSRFMAGMIAAVAMMAGGAIGLNGDPRRGGALVWAGSLLSIAGGAAGAFLQLVGYLRYTAFSIWAAIELPVEMRRTAWTLLLTGAVLFLMRGSRSSRRA